MAVATVEQFLTALENSKLLDPAQLARAKSIAPAHSDPQAIAWALVREGLLNRWQAGQLLNGRQVFFVGKYKLIAFLGQGGMGSVFLGEHVTMNRRVALKIVAKKLCRDPVALERLLAEARAGAALDHPNIVQAYSVDNEGDQYYLVMEYVDGRDLQQIVQEDGPMDYSAAADAIRQAAEGLAHAHQRNMIHCDIKPSNLLVNNQGTVKILDMGLARLLGENEQAADERMKGTVDYMAPEQGLGVRFDHRADIYALGCTFYFLLTGHPPFPEGTIAQRIIKHQTQQPQGILEQRPDAPRDLVKICRKMMAKQPDQRYQSADEVARALAQWKPTEPILKRAVPLDAVEAVPSNVPQGPTNALEEIAAMDFSLDAARSHASSARPRPRHGKRTSRKQQMLVMVAALVGVVILIVGAVITFVKLHEKLAKEESTTSMDSTAAPKALKDKTDGKWGPGLRSTAAPAKPPAPKPPAEAAVAKPPAKSATPPPGQSPKTNPVQQKPAGGRTKQ